MTDPAPDPAVSSPPISGIWKRFWSLVVLLHVAGAVLWLTMMPGGFPVTMPQFWVNRVAPLVMLAIISAAAWAALRRRASVLVAMFAVFPALWISAAISGRVLFPISMSRFWLAALAVGGLMMVALYVPARGRALRRWWMISAPVAAGIGLLLPFTQRSAPPGTRPLDVPWPRHEQLIATAASLPTARLAANLHVVPGEGLVAIYDQRMHIEAHPLLTFRSRSPDRFWTLLAPRRARVGPPREVIAMHEQPGRVIYEYQDDGRSLLDVRDDGGTVAIEALSHLDEAVYSHLNTLCQLTITGHRELALSFSPCDDVRIDVTHSQYPFGRPARFAYLDAAGVFRVVEARSAEKGPFAELASGRLERSEPLIITLYDSDEPVWRVTLEDWSAQADVTLSPTAGWGVPVNAIEFSRYDSSSTSPAGLWITLAATSVGRGYDSVGHAPGTYRNRLRVEPLRR